MSDNHKENLQNRYANNVESIPIYIDDAESGLRGYFCMGCNREMEAVKTKILGRASYFRHYVTKKDPKDKCTFSDKIYRHKLAKENLLINKRIKVPAVYKYSENLSEPGILLKPAEVIEAYSVWANLNFYEDESGNIKWTRSNDFDTEHLLCQPDITFFDKANTPFLFIEIATNHKPDKTKLLNLLRLGIDTVSVIIPKASPAEIDQVFEHTRSTKWLYNNDEINIEYIRVPSGDTEGISHIDEVQRQLFAESNRCRNAQIRNLIQRIGKVLGSQSYRDIESRVESEISRVEKNTEELQDRLINEETSIRKSIGKEFEEQTKRIDDEIYRVDKQYSDLEERYIRKNGEIEESRKRLIGSIGDLQNKIRSISGNSTGRERDHRREVESLERKIGDIELSIDGVFNDRRTSTERYYEHIRREEELIRRDQIYRAELPERSKRSIYEMVEKYRQEEEGIDENIKRSESIRGGFAQQTQGDEDRLGEEFAILNQSSIDAIEKGNFGENPYLSREYEALLSAERHLRDYVRLQCYYSRLTKIRKFIESVEYKNWV